MYVYIYIYIYVFICKIGFMTHITMVYLQSVETTLKTHLTIMGGDDEDNWGAENWFHTS